jgi:hypothetical protein
MIGRIFVYCLSALWLQAPAIAAETDHSLKIIIETISHWQQRYPISWRLGRSTNPAICTLRFRAVGREV